MGTQKLSAVWHIIFGRRNLEGKMRLILFIDQFREALKQDLETTATKAGKLHTLQALRAVTEDKIDNGTTK